MSEPTGPIPFEFQWLNAEGKRTVLTCWAATQREAEESARRAGWPGHDGTRLGQYRAWLREAVAGDAPPSTPPETNRHRGA